MPQTQIPAIVVEELLSSTSSDDGSHILFNLRIGQEATITIAIPFERAVDFMSLVSSATGDAGRLRTGDPNMKHTFPVEWWEIGSIPGNLVIFSFRLPGGMVLSFRVHRDAADRMRETLATILRGEIPHQTSGTARH